jgi:crotonobetainyl-CoA:carnitine CoA-transferase CaiB-like acyl-CoA transferase
MILGDLGAEVIKIEPPGEESNCTFLGPKHKVESFYWIVLNCGEKALTLDLT